MMMNVTCGRFKGDALANGCDHDNCPFREKNHDQ
jgi:hypothetical protein